MEMSDKLCGLAIGVLVLLTPVANAMNCRVKENTKTPAGCNTNATTLNQSPSPDKGPKRGHTKATGATPRQTLVGFVDARGCKLLVAESAARRMREINAVGSVIWDGKCINGLISGAGVLRQEGVSGEGTRSKQFVYYLSGKAQKGVRVGLWTRETFEHLVDSQLSWTSLAKVNFVRGHAKGAPRPIPVRGMNQHSKAFRARVLDAKSTKVQSTTRGNTMPILIRADDLSRKMGPSDSDTRSAYIAQDHLDATTALTPHIHSLSATPSLAKVASQPTEAASGESLTQGLSRIQSETFSAKPPSTFSVKLTQPPSDAATDSHMAVHAGAPALRLADSTELPHFAEWTLSQGAKGNEDKGTLVIHGDNSAFGYQIASPLIEVKPNSDVVIRIDYTIEAGAICPGILREDSAAWIVPASEPLTDLRFNSGNNKGIVVVMANCNQQPSGNPRSKFRLRSAMIASPFK